MKTARIEHDDNQLDVIKKVDELLKNHGLTIEFVDPETPKDGFEIITIKILK
jgi:hypothetical protein